MFVLEYNISNSKQQKSLDNLGFNTLSVSSGRITDDMIFSIIEDKSGKLWFATRRHGVCIYDGKSFTNFNENEHFIRYGVYSIMEDHNGNLYLTGDINKGTFNSSTGTWTQQKNLNDYFVMKGVKTTHCLDINNTTELLELHYDDLDFELGPAPYYYLKLKYPIHSVHPTQCLSVDPTSKQLEFNINTDYFDFETNSRRTLKPKFDANGVDDAGPLFIDFSTRKLRAKYNETLQVF